MGFFDDIGRAFQDAGNAINNELIQNIEKKAFLTLQRYIIYVTVSKILRKFFLLSENEQSKLIEVTIRKLGGFKKE